MIEPRTHPEWIDLARSDDPRDDVQKAVACLAQGGVVVLPGDASYSLAASALHPEAVARLRKIRGLEAERPLPIAVKGAEEFVDWVPDVSVVGRRIARKGWPGALTLVVDGGVARGLASKLPGSIRTSVAPGSSIGLRSPAHDAVREVLNLIPGPLILAGARASGGPPSATAEAAAALPDLDMIVDDGPIEDAGLDTLVRLRGEGWDLERAGRLGADDLAVMAKTSILFVCTGNTCRSPMAEALCQGMLARRLGCDPAGLESRGFLVRSAGLSAARGQRAAAEAIETVKSRGGSLGDHASRPVSADLVRSADLIVTMTGSHLDHLLLDHPSAAGRARLLDPLGGDVDDPIGGDLDLYRRTADAIEEHLIAILDDLGI